MSITCCGQKAKWIHINSRLEYWFCDECKKEVETPEQVSARLAKSITLEDIDNDVSASTGWPSFDFWSTVDSRTYITLGEYEGDQNALKYDPITLRHYYEKDGSPDDVV